MPDTKIKEHVSFSLEKKETVACAIFSKICCVAYVINCAGQQICLIASLHEHDRVGLNDKPALKSKVQ